MEFRTIVDMRKAEWEIMPASRFLFVGSCFAENIGRRFTENAFQTVVNPYGTMYNPASILHTVERAVEEGLVGKDGVDVAVFTLGTNHIYILKETGEIVDNCRKRPQNLFEERELTVEECCDYLASAIAILRRLNPDVKVILTVSPIRYRKYGYHESQVSKAVLLLAADKLCKAAQGRGDALSEDIRNVEYFPAYEIVNDELRDYRFYQPDMLHPSEQAVDYIYERFCDTYFSSLTKTMQSEWRPIKNALSHRPFDAESAEYKAFLEKAKRERDAFLERYSIRKV